jgi:hypothetical protein
MNQWIDKLIDIRSKYNIYVNSINSEMKNINSTMKKFIF